MRILITGAAGFLGRECANQLTAKGHQVVTTDRHGSIDLRGDLASPAFCASLPDADFVVHAAAVQYGSKDLPLLARKPFFRLNNIDAARNLCVRYGGKPTHFVHVGTSMMYDQRRLPLYETTSPMRGQGIYSRSKLDAQQYINALSNPHATVIPCIIGGRGREGLFRAFVKLMVRFGLVVFPGSGDHRTHMVHVKDVASLIACIIEVRATGLFNAAAPEPLTINQWVDEIENTLRLGKTRRFRPPLAPIHFLSWLTGFRLLAREQLLMLGQPHVLSIKESLAIGWQPQFTCSQIVRDTASYIATELAPTKPMC